MFHWEMISHIKAKIYGPHMVMTIDNVFERAKYFGLLQSSMGKRIDLAPGISITNVHGPKYKMSIDNQYFIGVIFIQANDLDIILNDIDKWVCEWRFQTVLKSGYDVPNKKMIIYNSHVYMTAILDNEYIANLEALISKAEAKALFTSLDSSDKFYMMNDITNSQNYILTVSDSDLTASNIIVRHDIDHILRHCIELYRKYNQ